MFEQHFLKKSAFFLRKKMGLQGSGKMIERRGGWGNKAAKKLILDLKR